MNCSLPDKWAHEVDVLTKMMNRLGVRCQRVYKLRVFKNANIPRVQAEMNVGFLHTAFAG